MSEIITTSLQRHALALPAPRVGIRIRPATLADVPFMDSLQKIHSKQLGYFPTKQFEGYVGMGGVLIAEVDAQSPDREGGVPADAGHSTPLGGNQTPLPDGRGSERLGYVISRDRYLKRDELGVIYQLCVVPGDRRKLVGAALLKAVFDRSAYGCRLYCCWCAQDIPANHFWESMGFVPVAFRGGSEKKKGLRGGGRVHIFWQKRIRPGDTTTPWWFPAKTEGGAMREDRIVLPIPPWMHWSDEMPVLKNEGSEARSDEGTKALPGESEPTMNRSKPTRHKKAAKAELVPGMVAEPEAPRPGPRKRVCLQYGLPMDEEPTAPPAAAPPAPMLAAPPAPAQQVAEVAEVGPKPPRQKPRCDPKFIAAARELRDKYLEQANDDPSFLLPAGKYELCRALPERPSPPELAPPALKALPAAA